MKQSTPTIQSISVTRIAVPGSDLFTCRHAFEAVPDLLDQPSVPASTLLSILHSAGPPIECNGSTLASQSKGGLLESLADHYN